MTEVNDKANVKQVEKWTKQILKNINADEKLVDVKLTGTTEKGEGFIGDIVFATIITSINSSTKQYEVVLKLGKLGNVRTLVPVQKLFEREIYFYTEVEPCFRQFSEKILGKSVMDMVPKCYGTLCEKDREIIFIQNLSKIGYRLNDRAKPMDMNHLKLTLENYATFHAVSFAMRDQEPERFAELCRKSTDHTPWMYFDENSLVFKEAVEHGGQHVYDALQDNGELELLEKYKTWKGQNDYYYFWLSYITTEFKEYVFTHGDCWNNNFMFQYYTDEIPVHCCFLDYQLCTLSSPVLDLSYHLSCVAPKEILSSAEGFAGLLDIYYSSLVENLKSLGSDPEKCFSYETFLRHWKSISPFGVILAGMVLPVSIKEKGEEVWELEDFCGEGAPEIVMSGETKRIVQQRLIAVVKHAFDLIHKM